jgi:aerobic-type carbon monoxide dehydrogenase small subunit (CoxS/CutS family)
MKLNVNGVEREIESPPLTPLLAVLREELGITGPKAGCQQGGCGACTVLVDGEALRACLVPLAALNGARVTTVEGLGTPDSLSPLQAAFDEHYAAQCGFCTSGMIVAAHALLSREPEPSRADIERALGGHVCRCTGYVKILEAVEAAAQAGVAGGAR